MNMTVCHGTSLLYLIIKALLPNEMMPTTDSGRLFLKHSQNCTVVHLLLCLSGDGGRAWEWRTCSSCRTSQDLSHLPAQRLTGIKRNGNQSSLWSQQENLVPSTTVYHGNCTTLETRGSKRLFLLADSEMDSNWNFSCYCKLCLDDLEGQQDVVTLTLSIK